ncbi:MAG: tRNA pseudouridine(38-40) synthase TruA [Epsilonproteobacteria bacterium]|nr:tRNA pseudouridine(38-40) synthase TruA [Campylobacterota bacterium]NPA57300.1 tRNA pseudouridine(38-40) synthase TruA [Campylobacterota bacterium]
MRVKGIVRYDGSQFFGFQCQKSTDRTVVATISRALTKLGIEGKVVGSGRTDRGVHATGQVVHFDLPPYWRDLERLRSSLNRLLHPSIDFRRIVQVDREFHARHWAKRRAYRYLIAPPSTFTPFTANYLHFGEIERELVARALPILEGTHDFRYFMKTGSGPSSTVRTIFHARLYTRGELTVLSFEADGFLRAQVRMMVSFLLAISENRLTLYHLQEQLEGKARYLTTLAPPQGLYLCRVVY